MHAAAVPAPAVARLRARRDGPLRRAVRGQRDASTTYAVHVAAVRDADARRRPRAIVAALEPQGEPALADAERFEDAASHRDRLAAFVRAAARMQRLTALMTVAMLPVRLGDSSAAWVTKHPKPNGC